MNNFWQLSLPIDVGIKIDETDPVRLLVSICEELNYSNLFKAYGRHWRKVHPVTMFELLVFGYMNNIYSSRDLELACKTDIRFMWLLQGKSVPDHSTFARFQNEKLTTVIEDLFYQLVNKLFELKEIAFKNIFIDGTKIEANANRYSFVWAKAVEKFKIKLENKIQDKLVDIKQRYLLKESLTLLDVLEYFQSLNITLITGKGHHKTQLQKDYETVLNYVNKLKEYENSLKICGKRKSYSKTDKDATFMRMKDDHMRNGQLKPAYNVQIGVDSEYIVGIGLFPNPTDTTTLIPFLQRIEKGTKERYCNIVADAGYASEENYGYLERTKQRAYIKPSNYEQRRTKKYQRDIYRVENMPYNVLDNSFTCPNGKKLKYIYESSKRTTTGYIQSISHYVCEDCHNCKHRSKCYTGKQENREIAYSLTKARQNDEAEKLLNTPQGILLRINRSIQVEGAFGVIKEDYGFRRFLTRGKRKTETQFFLISIAYNILKLHNRKQKNRLHQELFNKQIA